MKTIKEITPLKSNAPFVILKHKNAKFDYSIHYHNEFELNLITNFKGKRIVGDSIEECESVDLTLLGPELKHIWKSNEIISTANVITIQFQEHFLASKTLDYTIFKDIRALLELSKRGISIQNPTKNKIAKKISKLKDPDHFDSFLLFLEILHDLSKSEDKKVLSSAASNNYSQKRESRRITIVTKYIENNYDKQIKLTTLAEMINMSESAFSHYFKKRTGQSFIKYLLDHRLSIVTKLLSETNIPINEISYMTGFITLSNFNRSFKKKHGVSPKQYRINYINHLEE
ncbi:AraC family transcriptional regulator [Flavivirga rizhaonensis]|uniref:AraC family transcriptional regulator n=1 Tax=Flavivirga rizhaonensis TaxID=2559571 RepID=A0A4S1DY11_9FLAO|nr:AraC family transcriptional regulator [Flavivirga rizhaonensis]TGV02422.1 AraC family transcriptional regulator [Flavivirga rizhaonensis]